MFRRKIDADLTNWSKKNNRKSLILRGARQVGKTTAVRNFAKQFDNYIELNLDIEQEKDIFNIKSTFEELVEELIESASFESIL